ncbi:ABC transporter permease [Micromonospora sp. PTRAS2]
MNTVTDTILIYREQLKYQLRHKVGIIFGLVQPMLYLLLFGPLLSKLSGSPGLSDDSSWQTFVPGMLVYLALFGPGFAGFSVIADARFGVIERMRVTPVSRLALLLGRVLRDLTTLLVQSVIICVVGFALGLRTSPGGLILGLVIMLVLGAGLSALSLALGLMLKAEDQFAPLITSATLPVLLLSGILLPMQLAPRWLDIVSHFNPLRYVVDAIRAVFSDSWSAATLLYGAAAAVALAVICITIGTRTFARENA